MLGLLGVSLATPSLAAEVSAGDTAWMLTSTALVLMMCLPGLALLYGGMVRSKNLLSVGMQCFAVASLVMLMWFVIGYSLALSGSGVFVGGLDHFLLAGITGDAVNGSIPAALFVCFQMTFAVITPLLFLGSLVERIRFSTLLMLTASWSVLVYAPICFWVWGGGWLGSLGILDFAGGAVVHINAGIAGLVAAIMLGRREGYPNKLMPPNNLTLSLAGAALLWVGWFGFNAGSSVAADGSAAMAMLLTLLAPAAGALAWMFMEWRSKGKPTPLGIVSGVIAGLVAVTPAAGSVSPVGAVVIGTVAGLACYWASVILKPRFGYDDSLDVFGVHGVGGIVGALLTGVFAATYLGGTGFGDGVDSMLAQVGVQSLGIVAVIVYSGIVTALLFWISGRVCGGLRADAEQEVEGLDTAYHGERAYNL